MEQRPSDDSSDDLTRAVYKELVAARRSRNGLSPVSMATCPTLSRLLGDGDPVVAFQRLQHRILETLDTKDDVRAIEAAAYSLGLGSAANTHLDRLVDFGATYGYEARQARRYSDLGIEQLARLITSNWILHAVPTLEVFAVQQSNASLAVWLRTTCQDLIDMARVESFHLDPEGNRTQVDIELSDETSSARKVVQILRKPIVLAAAEPGAPRHLRFEWKGEVWPRFVMNVVGPMAAEHVLTTQTLGNAMQLTVEVPQPETQ